MARSIVFVRHGKAQARKEGLVDFERVLTQAGVRSLEAWFARAAGLVQAEHPECVEVWSSPAARACQTAELFAKALVERCGIDVPAVKEEPCLWEQDTKAFLEKALACEADLVVAVGHNPFCEVAVQELCGSDLVISPGGAALVRLEEASDAQNAPAHAERGDEDAASASTSESGRLLWFMQGPLSGRWKTLVNVESVIRRASATVDKRLEAFLEQPEDVETAHKLRISIRTLRGLLAFVAPFQQRSQNLRMQRDLRTLVACTSRLREYDVLARHVAELDAQTDELLQACMALRERECAYVVKTLTSKDATRRFKRVAKSAEHFAWKRSVEVEGLAPQALDERFDELADRVRADLQALELADEEWTHDVRKQAKQVRYAAEHFDSLLGPGAADTAREMKAEQDRLGELCDARVNVQIVDEFPRDGLSDQACWALSLLRARNESFIYTSLCTG